MSMLFHVLAIVNSAVMSNGIHVSYSILVSQGICLRVGLMGHAATAAAKSLQSCTTL